MESRRSRRPKTMTTPTGLRSLESANPTRSHKTALQSHSLSSVQLGLSGRAGLSFPTSKIWHCSPTLVPQLSRHCAVLPAFLAGQKVRLQSHSVPSPRRPSTGQRALCASCASQGVALGRLRIPISTLAYRLGQNSSISSRDSLCKPRPRPDFQNRQAMHPLIGLRPMRTGPPSPHCVRPSRMHCSGNTLRSARPPRASRDRVGPLGQPKPKLKPEPSELPGHHSALGCVSSV